MVAATMEHLGIIDMSNLELVGLPQRISQSCSCDLAYRRPRLPVANRKDRVLTPFATMVAAEVMLDTLRATNCL